MKTARIYAMLLLAVLTVSMLAGCSAEDIESIGKNNRENQIILGTSADYAPFEFHMVIGGLTLDGQGRYVRIGDDPSIYSVPVELLDSILVIALSGFEG